MAEMQFENTDPNVSLEIQVGSGHAGPVVMVGTYTTSPDKMDARLESWTVLAHILRAQPGLLFRSEEHTSELQSLMRISYAVFCLNKKNLTNIISPSDIYNETADKS